MISRQTIFCYLCLFLANFCGGTNALAQIDSFDSRRDALLDVLTAPEMLTTPITSASSHSYRREWTYYDASLAKGVNLAEANNYFATSSDIVAGEWQVLQLVRTYYAFKDTVLTEPAKTRMLSVLQEYKEDFDSPGNNNPERYGTTGNHSIVGFSTYLLLDQLFGNGPDHSTIVTKTKNWVRKQVRNGRDEVNSPHYLERSLIPLLNLYDYSTDPELQTWAQIGVDQLIGESALMSLDNVRGGPWVRAHQNFTPGLEEMNDGRQDAFYVAGYQFFGNSALPEYVTTEQTLIYNSLATTSYRPAQAVIDMSDSTARGTYQVLGQRDIVQNDPDEWDLYYHLTPSFSLAAVQDRAPLDNVVTGSLTNPGDFVNTQVWELTFSDPTKILGAKRDLGVNTGTANNIIEPNNPNTANMQYKNVLFYKGEFLDFNNNLTEGGGEYSTETSGAKQLHFWRVVTPAGDVYVAATQYPSAGGGILETREADSTLDFVAFKNAIRAAPSSLQNTGNQTSYTSTLGDQIAYSNSNGNHGNGTATVNGSNFPLSGYGQYESPYMNSTWGGNTITTNYDAGSLLLDVSNFNNPKRIEVFAADFNTDGSVGLSDLAAWQGNYGIDTNALHSQGDAIADGNVDGLDFLKWQRQSGLGSASSTVASVPEPATGLLLTCASFALAFRRRKRLLSQVARGTDTPA